MFKKYARKSSALMTAVLILGLLSGCGGSETAATAAAGGSQAAGTETSQAADSTPQKDSVVVGITEPSELVPDLSTDLTGKQIFVNIYDNLMIIDNEGNYVPRLATDYTISDDQLTITFNLREGVTFHNGEAFTAEDVEYTLNRYKANKRMSKYYLYMTDVEVVDDYTVALHYSQPNSAALECLFSPRGSLILDKTTAEDPNVDLLETPIGTGPFKFVSRATGDKIVLERYDGYWGEAPAYKDLIYKVVNDSNAAIIALETGEVDLVYSVDEIHRANIESNDKLSLYSELIAGTYYLALNTSDEVLSDVRVRQAISHAINKEELLTACEQGYGAVSTNILAWNAKGTPSDFQDVPYDIEKAKALLAEAGYPDGLTLSLHTTQERPLYYNISQVLQGQLAKAGITVDMNVTDYASMVEAVNTNHDYQMNINMYSLLAQDNATFMPQLCHSEQIETQTNYAEYNNPEVDRLLEAARDASNEADMEKSYREFAEIIRDDAPYIPLYANYTNVVANSNLKGVVANSMSIMYSVNWYWE